MSDPWNTLLGARVPYQPPEWLSNAAIPPHLLPSEKVSLGRFPTPLQTFSIPGLSDDLGLDCYVKRDDISSFDLSGNKVRKLEFLLAEATRKADNGEAMYDSVITVGGIQSNHARATAVASRQLGLNPYLILRTAIKKRKQSQEDLQSQPCSEVAAASADSQGLGLVGNLLFSRLIDADIRLVSPATYAAIGSDNLCAQLAEDLRKPPPEGPGKRPYCVPVGGSSEVGVFGYIETVREIAQQCKNIFSNRNCYGKDTKQPPQDDALDSTTGQSRNSFFDHIVFACGSGGTAAGMAIGAHLSGMSTSSTSTSSSSSGPPAGIGGTQLHAIAVCDSPDVFYAHIESMAAALGVAHTPHYSSLLKSGAGHHGAMADSMQPTTTSKPAPATSNPNSAGSSEGLPPNTVRDWINIYAGNGIGYAKSTPEELEFIKTVAARTGIIFDPVYSGKGLYHFVKHVVPAHPEVFKKGQRLLFIHTGGVPGLYDKEDEMLPLLDASRVTQMKVRNVRSL